MQCLKCYIGKLADLRARAVAVLRRRSVLWSVGWVDEGVLHDQKQLDAAICAPNRPGTPVK